jgi:integrase
MGRRLIGPRQIHGKGGLYFAVYRAAGGSTLRESLGTRDHEQAMLLWPAAYQRLRDLANGKADVRPRLDEKVKPLEVVEITEAGKGPIAMPGHVFAGSYLRGGPEDHCELDWEEALEVHMRRRHERTGKPLAESTRRSIRKAFELVSKKPSHLDPKDVKDYVELLREKGYKATSISQRCSLLQGVTQSLVKTGWIPHQWPDGTIFQNPWEMIDTSAANKNHIPTASPQQCRTLIGEDCSLNGALRLAIRLMLYTGCRIGEITSRRPEDLEDGWLTIDVTPTWRPKSDNSRRILPVPVWCEAIPARWPGRTSLNEAIQRVTPGISSHSLRHAWRTACREAEITTELAEHLMGHSQSVQLAGVYGKFSQKAKLEAMRKVWLVIDGWVGLD